MRRRALIALVFGATIAWAQHVQAQSAQPDQRVADLVRAGKIRIGVFPTSTQFSKDSKTGEPKGLAMDITRALAARLGVGEVVPVEYPRPTEIVACVKAGGCEFGFIAIDAGRLTEVDFTPAYIRRDFTYLVPADSSIRRVADVDRAGVRIAAARGHASTAALVRVIKQANLVFAEDLAPAFDLLRAGSADAVASTRESLLRYSAKLPGLRVIEDGYDVSLVGIAMQKGHPGRLAYVSEFLDELKRSGWMRRAIDSAGLRGFEVAIPKVSN